jgi:hypothetical protein
MRLEYFGDAFEGRGLLLLYGDSVREAKALRVALRPLLAGETSVNIHELPFVEPIRGCRVTAESAATAASVLASPKGHGFRWVLTPPEWEDTDTMLEPFCNATAEHAGCRFQYLNPHEGPEVIYSTERAW